jgi:hypothetical protein
MRKPLVLVALAAAAALAACEDSSPLGPGDELALIGTFAAAPVPAGELGAFGLEAEAGGELRDMIAEGASIVLGIHANGSTSGRLFIPEEGSEPEVDAGLAGTWSLEDGRVRLDPAAESFLGDLAFEVEGNVLVADGDVDGARVRIELERVTGQGGDTAPGPEGFEVTGDVAILESFPVQLVGSMTFTNVSDETRELQTDVCWPQLRAYVPGDDAPAWDQGEEGACALFTPRIDEVEPGESVRFESPVVSAADILDDDLPDGTYRITIYFRVIGGEEIELEGGEVELAVSR